MIDNFSLAVSHGLILLALWRLLSRPDLDDTDAPEPDRPAQPSDSKPRRLLGAPFGGRRRA
jgi:hypothetical protein